MTVHHRFGSLVVPTVDPVLAYVDSARDVFEPGLPPGMTWEQVLATVGADVTAEIDEHRAFRCPCIGDAGLPLNPPALVVVPWDVVDIR